MTSLPTRPPSTGTEDAQRSAELRGIARAGTISLIGSAASALLGFILVVQVSRGLGAAGAGAFSVVVAVAMTLAVVGRFGTDTALVRMAPRFRALGRTRDISAAAVAALAPVFVGTTLLAVAAWWAAPQLVHAVFEQPAPPGAVWLIRVGVATVPLAATGYVALAVTRGLGSVVPLTLVESITKPALRCVFVGVAVAAAHQQWPAAQLSAGPVLWTTVAWAVPTLLGGVWSAVLAHRALREVRAELPTPDGANGPAHAPDNPANAAGGPSGAAATWRELWCFATPRAAASACEIAGMHAGLILVSALAGVADAGVYNAALRLALAGTLALQALRLAIAPTLARLLTVGDLAGVEHLHRTAAVWITVVSFPLYLVFAVWPTEVLRLFGPGFSAGGPALALLAAGTLVNLATGPVSTLLLMSGRSTFTLAVTATSLTCGIALAVLLIPQYGVTGAALAKAAAVVGENLAVTLIVRGTVGVRTLSRPLFRAAFAGVACFVFPALAYDLATGHPVPDFRAAIILVLLGSAAYLVLLRRWRTEFALADLAAALPTHRLRLPGVRRRRPAEPERPVEPPPRRTDTPPSAASKEFR
ncbi:oligosaccharide flippase family protein [Cryptosporangium aurantiacum]|uniref:Membrane protein involved in the export of O-antigen and teichoic acid n=1 Tax=Cryptosporangium aurantiacum TaxID=134849 RepID=A0A1M7RJ95_9ACTN|nr:oligosaccharide flippase family protein [Cryptosporangium aurantiacum]SHN46367.1 Membrane protein involved in the export of O-antigen and teichoic acid [Cryptosporangium aurantiacum]